jgi:probable phosphomutase (TIGR03848 family)
MTTLFLIRHGLTGHTGKTLYGRTPGISLDDRGRHQAEQLAERFDGIRLAAIYSSPLERCVETVVPLAERRALRVEPLDGLIEMDSGSWTGRSLAQLRRTRKWRELHASPAAFRFPGGESFVEAQARALEAVSAVGVRHPSGDVVMASHGDVIGMIVAHFGGAHLDQFQRTSVDPASVSVVRLQDGVPLVLLVNDTGGLARFARRRADRNLRG